MVREEAFLTSICHRQNISKKKGKSNNNKKNRNVQNLNSNISLLR
jgi:hypothetical protein